MQQQREKKLPKQELILKAERVKVHTPVVGMMVISPSQKGYNKRVRKPGDVTIMLE